MVDSYDFPSNHRPLDSTEREQVLEAARECRQVAEVVTLFHLFSGMKNRYAAHVTEKMVHTTSNGIEIRVPPGEHKCESGGTGQYHRTQFDDVDGCGVCSGYITFRQPRIIPIHDERATMVIKDWFELHDSLPATATHYNLTKLVGRQAGIPRLNPTVLRDSLGVLLAENGFSSKVIVDVMGFCSLMGEPARKIHAYGEISEGPSPYLCGADRVDGGSCEIGVLNPDHDQCRQHRGTKCNAKKSRGGRCSREATEPDSRCIDHTRTQDRCGFEIGEDESCSRVVSKPDERCHSHTTE